MTQATPPRRTVRRSTLYFFGALGGILFGYDTAVISGVLPFVTKHWHLTGVEQGFMTASISVGSILGALASTRLNDRFGRRRTIMTAAVVAIAAILSATFATNLGMLTAARFVLGMGVGLCASTVPSYLSELAPARRRGAIGSLNQLFIVLGDLLAFVVDYLLGFSGNWRAMLAGALIPALALLIGMARLPESPRWLLKNGREAEARAVLTTSHGGTEHLDKEIAAIQEVIRLDTERSGGIRQLFTPWVRPMLLVAVILAAGQQFCGVTTINTYFPTMLIGLGFATQAALLAGVGLGIAKVLFTSIEMFTVDRWGRKRLLLNGNVFMAVAMLGSGLVVFTVHDPAVKGGVALTLMMLFLAAYELGWGAVVWLMMSEVFPLRARAAGMGVSSVVLWSAGALVKFVFPVMSDKHALGIGGTMFVFAGVNVVLFVLTKWLVPETKGRTLEEIELDLRGRTRTKHPTTA